MEEDDIDNISDSGRPLIDKGEDGKSSQIVIIDGLVHEKVKVPIWRRVILILGAWFFMITIGFMTVSGFQNMRKILVDEGVYRWLCHNQTHPNVILQTSNNGTVEPCKEQIYMYGLMITLSGALLNGLILVAGPMCDIFGPKITGLVGMFLDITGTLIFAFSSEKFPGYIVGYVLMSVGGMFVVITFLHLNNILPMKLQFFFNSLVMSSTDTGAVVFLVFQYICEHTKATLRHLMLGYLGILLLCCVYVILLQPMQAYRVGLVRLASRSRMQGKKKGKNFKTKIMIYLKNWWKVIKTLKVWLLLLYQVTSTQLMYYYMQTFHEQLLYLSTGHEDEKVERLIYVWGILFLFVGVCVSMVMAGIMNIFDVKKSEGASRFKNMLRFFTLPSAFFFIGVLISSWTIFSSIPNLNVQYLAIISFLAFRSCCNSLYTTASVTYFGDIAISVIGTQTAAAGVFTLSNYGFQVAAYGNYRPFNIAFGSFFALQCAVLCCANVYWLYKKYQREDKEKEMKNDESVGILEDGPNKSESFKLKEVKEAAEEEEMGPEEDNDIE